MLWIQSFWQPIGLLQDNGVQSPIGLASVHSGCLPLRSRVKQETRSGSPLFRRQLSRFTSTYMYGDGCRASCRSAWFAQLCSYMYIYIYSHISETEESAATGKHNKIDCNFHAGSLAFPELTTQLFHMSRRQEPVPLTWRQKKKNKIKKMGKAMKIARKMEYNTREQLLHNALALANKTPSPLARYIIDFPSSRTWSGMEL